MNEFVHSLELTFAQAFASALIATIFGFLGALGLSAAPQKWQKFSAAVALIPNTLPIIFVIFSFMKYLSPARGFLGIVAIHSFLNSGLAAIAIFQILQSKLGRLSEVAYIEGCGQFRFMTQILLPYLKADLLRVFFFVFAICFTSFAVPLMIGGSSGTTLEVLIYEKIRISADWSQAFLMALAELAFILVLSLFLKLRVVVRANYTASSPLLGLRVAWIIVYAPAAFVVFCLVQSLFEMKLAPVEITDLVLGSFFIAIGSGLLSLTFLLSSARFRPTPKIRRTILGIAAPSSVLIGFALLFVFHASGWFTYFKLILGLSLMHFPVLYRLSWDNQIFGLNSQIETAEIIGASPNKIFSRVVLPQVLAPAYHLAGLAALWAFSDFTLASVVAEKDLTLAQLFSHLTESYRWEAAEALILPMILGSILCYALFSGVGYVASRSALR